MPPAEGGGMEIIMINELLNVELEEVRLDEKLNKDLADEIEETLANGCGALKSCNGCNSLS